MQTADGKVSSVFHESTENSEAVNLKKSIVAAFQANFKGTEEEEEIDPQSKHISHYRYLIRIIIGFCFYSVFVRFQKIIENIDLSTIF